MVPAIIPITPPPLEAVPCPREADLYPRREFGAPMDAKYIAAKDHTLQRRVPKVDNAKIGSGLLFPDNNPSTLFASDSTESPTLFTNTNSVSNFPVSSPLFGDTAHSNSPMMDGSVSGSTVNDPTSLAYASDSAVAARLFKEYLVDDASEDDMSFLFTPQTNDTSFTSTSMSGLDTPSIDLAQLDQYLNSSSLLGDRDFNLFGDSHLDVYSGDLFPLGSRSEDTLTQYVALYDNPATVTSASPQQFYFSSNGDNQSTKAVTLPSPELSPSTSRKAAIRRPSKTPAARKSSTPYTPITPAPTTPSTPQVISRATKRRLPVIDEDPAVVEKRRRNTIAAQRSRQRKAEEKMEDRVRIEALEKDRETLRTLVSYWKDRACELGASPLEDGEN